MWLNQNEIQSLWKKNIGNDVKVDFRLFAPNNATLLSNTFKGENSLSISNYYKFIALNIVQNFKNIEKKENVNTLIGITQHFSENEKTIRKQATEFDKIKNKYIYDPTKVDFLAMSYDFYRQQKWKNLLGYNSKILNNQLSTINNTIVNEIWGIVSNMRKRDLVFENLKLNYYNPKKQFYVNESETKKIVKTGKLHYLKFKINKEDIFKLTNVILDNINESLTQHITFQNDLVERIKQQVEKKTKKTSIKNILGLSRKEFEDFDNSFNQKEIENQKNLEYLKGHLLVVEQNVNTLKKIKTILLYQYNTSIIVCYENLWHSLFTMALAIKKDVIYSIYYLSKTKELVVVPEVEAVNTLSILLEETIVNSPEVSKKIDHFKDSSEFFNYLNVGIQKVASIKGSELEGMRLDLVGDLDIEDIDYNKRSNIGKLVVLENDEIENNIVPVHQFNILTFDLLNQLNFPILNKLTTQGKLVNLGQKFSNLENYIATYSENYLTEIYERENDYFSCKSGVKIEKIYSNEDSVTELYPLPEKNWFINFPSYTSLASRNEWAIPLPMFSNESKNIWIDNLEDLSKKSINPIYRVVLGKNLKYEFFEESKAVIMSDSISKIPLGLSTTQYRSRVLTDLRKEKRVEWSVFCAYADKLYEEVLELFQKYDIVQIQFNNEESVKWQNWFFGKEEDFISNSNTILYFYKKVNFENNEISYDNNFNYLNLQKNSISNIFIKDDYDNVYKYSGFTLDYPQEEKMLDLLVLKKAFEESNQVYYLSDDKLSYDILLENYEYIFQKQKLINRIDLPKINNTKDIEYYLSKFDNDVVTLTLFMHEELNEELIENNLNEELLLAENLNRFFFHRSFGSESSREQIILWLNSKTNNLQKSIENNAKVWNFKSIYSEIHEYIKTLNELIFPIIKNLPNNDKSKVQYDLILTLSNFVVIIRPFLPILSEKIFQSLYEEKLTLSKDHLLNCFTLKTANAEIITKIDEMIELKKSFELIKNNFNIPYYQSLYADFSYLKVDQVFVRYIQTYFNLVPKSLMNVDGQLERLDFNNNPIIIDLVLDTNLIALAAQKELSKIILNFKNQNKFKLKQVVKLQIRYTPFEDQKILNKLKLNTYWPDLFTETIWNELPIDNLTEVHYKLLDIAKVSLNIIN
jgi:Anticodon-binding domain of tRNA ligase